MILPISHERTTVQSWPWVTFGLMAMMILCFLMTLPQGPGGASWSGGASGLLDTPETTHEAGAEATAESAAQRWGLVPAAPRGPAFFTYLFVHGGWLHLALNLLFLYLTGPFIEDAWGRLPFLVFFLSAGAVVGGLYTLKYPLAVVPLIGASGAIAAVLGAFLIRFGRTEVDFVYWLVVLGGTFSAPAWVLLPLWLGGEWVRALAQDARGLGGASGVAYWVHVWGFLVGAAVALAAHALSGGASSPRRPVGSRELLLAAQRARAEGRDEEAWQLLAQAVRLDPADEVRRDLFWELSRELGKESAAAAAILGDVRNQLRRRSAKRALERWRLIEASLPGFRAPAPLLVELAKAAYRCRYPAETRSLLAKAVAALTPDTPVETILNLLRATRGGDPRLHRRTVAIALAHPQLDPLLRRQLEAEAGA
jgi:membrane associated rhomboid family serine protease